MVTFTKTSVGSVSKSKLWKFVREEIETVWGFLNLLDTTFNCIRSLNLFRTSSVFVTILFLFLLTFLFGRVASQRCGTPNYFASIGHTYATTPHSNSL